MARPRMQFFFYGTLLDGSDNPVAHAVHRRLEPLSDATTFGTLHAIPDPAGWFPALVAGESRVNGRVYEARDEFSDADLARLDAYEDYLPGRPEASLYVRQAVKIARAGEANGIAEAYVWNRQLPPGSEAIACGDFREWLAQNSAMQFAGLRGT